MQFDDSCQRKWHWDCPLSVTSAYNFIVFNLKPMFVPLFISLLNHEKISTQEMRIRLLIFISLIYFFNFRWFANEEDLNRAGIACKRTIFHLYFHLFYQCIAFSAVFVVDKKIMCTRNNSTDKVKWMPMVLSGAWNQNRTSERVRNFIYLFYC